MVWLFCIVFTGIYCANYLDTLYLCDLLDLARMLGGCLICAVGFWLWLFFFPSLINCPQSQFCSAIVAQAVI